MNRWRFWRGGMWWECSAVWRWGVFGVVSRKSGFAVASESAEGHLQHRWCDKHWKNAGVLCDGGSAETEVATEVQTAWLHGGGGV